MSSVIRNPRKERSALIQKYEGARVRYAPGRFGTVVDFSIDLQWALVRRDKKRGDERGILRVRLTDPSIEFEA